jgi:hypothetical protein
MKAVLLGLIAAILLVPGIAMSQDPPSVVGTWSGSWTPKGGVMDAVTVEISQDSGKLVGKFRSPAAMDFSSVSFDARTGAVKAAATDSKSGKAYRIDGKLTGNEIKGTLTVGDTSGDLLLIKWTYVPR